MASPFLDATFDQGMMSPVNSSPGSVTCRNSITNIISMLESPQPGSENMFDSEPIRILKDVTAYVEVRSKNENRSNSVCHELRQLGAEVVDKLGSEVTHVIWKEGRPSTRDRAKKRGMHVVTVLWVASCKQNGEHVSEDLFQVMDTQKENTYTPVISAKLKKAKSMQPNDFESELADSAERGQKKRKRQGTADRFKMLKTPRAGTPLSNPRFYVAETQPRSPFSPYSPNITVPDTPPSMRARLNSLQSHKENESPRREDANMFSPLSRLEKTSPLKKKLFASPDVQKQNAMDSPTETSPIPDVSIVKRTTSKQDPMADLNRQKQHVELKNSSDSGRSKVGITTEKKASRKHKLLSLNMDAEPKLLSPCMSSNAAQVKPSILTCGRKKNILKKVTYAGESPPHLDAGGKRKRQLDLEVNDDPSPASHMKTEDTKDPAVKKSAARRKSGRVELPVPTEDIEVKTEVKRRRKSVVFQGPKVDSGAQETSPEIPVTTSQSSNQTKVTKARRKSVAICSQETLPDTSTADPVRRSRRKSMVVLNSQIDSTIDSEVKDSHKMTDKRSSMRKNSDNNISRVQSINSSIDTESHTKPKARRRSVAVVRQTEEASQPAVDSQIDTPTLPKTRRRSVAIIKSSPKVNPSDSSESNSTSTPTSSKRKSSEQGSTKSSGDLRKFVLQKQTKTSSSSKRSSSSSSEEEGKKGKVNKKKWIKQQIAKSSCPDDGRTLVMTSLHFDEQEMVVSVVQKLGGFRLVESIGDETRHVVCGSNRRTLNVLHAITRGCWLLSLEWVFKSLEAGKWLPEDTYEQHRFFPAVQTSRLLHEEGRKNELFKNEGVIYVSDKSSPPKSHIEQFIIASGGKISQVSNKASICVGNCVKVEVPTVSEQWVLDSITAFEVLPVEGYQHNSSQPDRPPSPDY